MDTLRTRTTDWIIEKMYTSHYEREWKQKFCSLKDASNQVSHRLECTETRRWAGTKYFWRFLCKRKPYREKVERRGGEREEEAQRRTLIKCHKQRDKKEGRYEKRKA